MTKIMAHAGLNSRLKPVMVMALQAVALILIAAAGRAQGEATFTVVNNCEFWVGPKVVTHNKDGVYVPQLAFGLDPGGSEVLTIGDHITGIWASPTGHVLGKFCTKIWRLSDDSGLAANKDAYFVSIDPAYNIGVEIRPTFSASGAPISESECAPTSCTIDDIQGVCRDGNAFAGPDSSCIAGSLDGAKHFETACPQASLSLVDGITVKTSFLTCHLHSSYNVTFCPTPTKQSAQYDDIIRKFEA